MKRLLLPLITALALPTAANAGCFLGRCSSYSEAITECNKWRIKGPKKSYVTHDWGNPLTVTEYLRSCSHEKETKQLLGWQFTMGIDELVECKRAMYCENYKKEVKAHFRY